MTAPSHSARRTVGGARRFTALLGVGALTGTLALAGCAPEPTAAGTSAPPSGSVSAPSPSASATSASSPTSTPEQPAATPVSLDLGLDELVLTDSNGDEKVLNITTDPAGVRQALFDLFGEVAATRPDERYPIDLYQWPGLTLNWIDGAPASASVTFLAADEGGIALASAGLSVGSTVAEVEAAGAEMTPYGTYDDVTGYRLNVEKVPGTSSLVNPGEEGVRYLSFSVVGGVVTRLSVGNDFSDL